MWESKCEPEVEATLLSTSAPRSHPHHHHHITTPPYHNTTKMTTRSSQVGRSSRETSPVAVSVGVSMRGVEYEAQMVAVLEETEVGPRGKREAPDEAGDGRT